MDGQEIINTLMKSAKAESIRIKAECLGIDISKFTDEEVLQFNSYELERCAVFNLQ